MSAPRLIGRYALHDAWKTLGHMPDAGAWHAYPSHTNVSPSPMPETNVSSWDSCPSGDDAAPCTCKAAFVPNSACRYSILDQISTMRAIFDAHGLAGKAMYVTEGGFNADAALPDTNEQVAYLARWYLLLAGAGVARVYYYAQDDWAPLVDGAGALNELGVAYNALHDWLVGGAIGACHADGTVWACPVTTPDQKPAFVTWDAATICTTSSCPTTATAVDASYTTWRDLSGNAHAITGATIPLGSKPVLVE